MVQTTEQTHEQKVKMYKKEKKIKLIEMLIECNNQLDAAIKNRTIPIVTRSALQLCPKCNGQGIVSKPPWVAGDVHQWTSSATSFVCDVCNGAKVI